VADYEDWTTEELIAARMQQLEVVREAVDDLNALQLAIVARGKTRRAMMAEGCPWVGY